MSGQAVAMTIRPVQVSPADVGDEGVSELLLWPLAAARTALTALLSSTAKTRDWSCCAHRLETIWLAWWDNESVRG